MSIVRSGPPSTHDSLLWRVPLNGRPSSAWQKAFESADESSGARTPRRVHFEVDALTFRSDESEVVQWVESLDRWIAHANGVLGAAEQDRRDAAERAQAGTDARRQRASDANERFKDL